MLIRPAVPNDAAAISALILGEARHITLEPDGRGAEAMQDTCAGERRPERITVNASLCGAPAHEHLGFLATGPRVETKGIAFVPMVFSFSTPSSSGAHA